MSTWHLVGLTGHPSGLVPSSCSLLCTHSHGAGCNTHLSQCQQPAASPPGCPSYPGPWPVPCGSPVSLQSQMERGQHCGRTELVTPLENIPEQLLFREEGALLTSSNDCVCQSRSRRACAPQPSGGIYKVGLACLKTRPCKFLFKRTPLEISLIFSFKVRGSHLFLAITFQSTGLKYKLWKGLLVLEGTLSPRHVPLASESSDQLRTQLKTSPVY